MSVAIEPLGGSLSKPDLEAISQVAMEAFLDDPFFVFLSDSERLRRRSLPIFFGAFVKYLGRSRTIFVARDNGTIVGVSAWAAPGTYPPPLRDQLMQTLFSFWALVLSPKALIHGVRYLLAMEKAHPKHEVWYLALLAVTPDYQRRGIGGLLMDQVLAQCDEEGHDVYLETQKEDNLAYYRRVGFLEGTALRPVTHGPPLWTMYRATKAS